MSYGKKKCGDPLPLREGRLYALMGLWIGLLAGGAMDPSMGQTVSYVRVMNSQELVPLRANLITVREQATKQRPKVDLEVFRGEVEPFQVVLTPESSSSLKDIHLEFTPLVHREDPQAVFPPENLEWFRVEYVNWERPDILRPGTKFANWANEFYNYPMWVRLRVPREARPGLYQGEVLVQAHIGTVARIPLQVRVWDAAIPRQAHFNTAEFGFWESHIADQMGIPVGSPEMRELLTRGAESLADHRIVHDNDSIGPVPYQRQYDALTPEGQAEILQWCEFWTQRGLRLSCSFRTVGMNPTPEKKEYARRFWKIYGPLLRERGWDRMVYTKIADEWHGDEGARGCVEVGRFLKSLMPTLQIAATSIGTDDPHQDQDRWLGHFQIASQVVTIWGQSAYNHLGPYRWPIWFRNDKIRQFLIERAAAGDHVWPYIHATLAFHQPDGYAVRSFLWRLSAYGFDGCWLWGTTAWGRPTDKESNRILRNRVGLTQIEPYASWQMGDGILYWPGEDRLLESVRLEQVRDGIEDWECFRLLGQRLQRAEKDPDRYKRWIRKAREALRRRDGQVSVWVSPHGGFEHRADPEYFARARRALGEALEETPGALRWRDED